MFLWKNFKGMRRYKQNQDMQLPLGVMLQNDIKAVENETAGFRDAVVAGKGAVGKRIVYDSEERTNI